MLPNFGRLLIFCQITFWPLNDFVLPYQYILSFWFDIVYVMGGLHPDQDLLIRITKNSTENVVPDYENSTSTNR